MALTADESVAAFAERHFGSHVARVMLRAAQGGICTGGVDALSAVRWARCGVAGRRAQRGYASHTRAASVSSCPAARAAGAGTAPSWARPGIWEDRVRLAVRLVGATAPAVEGWDDLQSAALLHAVNAHLGGQPLPPAGTLPALARNAIPQ